MPRHIMVYILHIFLDVFFNISPIITQKGYALNIFGV